MANWYAYSAVWLALGLALLGYGVWRGLRETRWASAFLIFATTLKVFLFDLAGLEGLSALSFLGLGARFDRDRTRRSEVGVRPPGA